MSETEKIPEFEETIRRAVHTPDPAPGFVSGLRTRLVQQAAGMRTPRTRPHTAWRWALAAIGLLVIAFLAIGPRNVVEAMQRLLGYVPGVGVVSQETTLRVLSEPVTVERDGITMTVESALLDAQRTVIIYSTEGISLAVANEGGEGAPNCRGNPAIILPDGTSLTRTGSRGSGWGTGYRDQLVFPFLPTDVTEVTLVIPCVWDMPPGRAPEDWQFALRFEPAPADMTVMPVIDITPLPEETGTGSESETEAPFGISIALGTVITTEDGYILVGQVTSNDARLTVGIDTIKVFDATGQEIPSQSEDPYSLGLETSSTSSQQWGIRIQGHAFDGPLTLRAVSVFAQLAAPPAIPFEPGTDLQEGQEWQIDQTLDVLGYPIQVLTARYMVRGDMHGFEFTASIPPELDAPSFGLDGIVGGLSGSGGSEPADESGITHFYILTDGRIESPLALRLYSILLKGSWETTWTPPGSSETGTPAPSLETCLDLDTWKQIRTLEIPLPSDLNGTLLTMRGALAPEPSLFISALDGSDTRPLVFGYGSLSPDSTQMVYSDSAGSVHILELATGSDVMLDPATVQARQVAWSPDGQYIAYDQFTDAYNVYVMNANGSNPCQITFPPGMQFIEGWTPDSKQVLVSNLGDGGTMLMLVDIETGAVTDLFTVTSKGSVGTSISPDGQWVAFVDRGFGEMVGSVFISHLDGSDRRPIVQMGYWPAINPSWSPDGQWLAISVLDGDAYEPGNEQIALINVNTCEVIPLHGVEGEVRSWRP